jgi:hypothetical protein
MLLNTHTAQKKGPPAFSKRVSSSPNTNAPVNNPVKRYYVNESTSSRKAAIDAMCASCMGCSASEQGARFDDWIEPGFRDQIRNCSAPHCPLHSFRPYQEKP